jgi:CMP-N,N'-diacetyllegionaminic acid synthase
MLVLGLVPARGGSKGVPGKNVRPLAGHTLLEYTARAARESGVLDRVILSTDSLEVADAGRRAGLEVPFMRPASLAADDTPMVAVIQHAVAETAKHGWSPDIIVLLQPTSPLRRPDHIRDAVNLLRESKADSVVTVNELPLDHSPDYLLFRNEDGTLRPFLPEGAGITRRQDARPAHWRDGTVYTFWRATLERFGNIYGEKCQSLVLDESESLSIDTQRDWELAEQILLARRSGSSPSLRR